MTRSTAIALALLAAAVIGSLIGSRCSAPPAAASSSPPVVVSRPTLPLLPRISIEGPREIGPNQTITVLRVPEPHFVGTDVGTTYCVIYENHMLGTSEMVCR